ncbi:sigma-54 dependent transcriptional regulator [Sphingobium sp.]|uniref:sigma-54-dependent transcriptional regulator n=1 Tax=Sphingobium sp. TaxID=1912891 RepID=UPI002CF447B4|nr:sigma-54 dependent transcriptional regulator [Sphingobium sp.]HUD90412.1 sigma-54 dependent transcriptional regulator [Sphingobium sp.]
MNDVPPRQIVLVDDDDDLRAAMAQTLALAGYQVRSFARSVDVLDAVDGNFPGIVVSDVRMPHMSGIDLFQALQARDPELPVILVTGHGDVPMAVDALKAGAWDFLTKPFDPDGLISSVGRASEKRLLVIENRRLRAMVDNAVPSPLIGHSPAIERLRDMVATLADTNIDILIEGETGTGKELVARMIHQRSQRASAPFVSIACAAVPDAIAETSLHGESLAGRAPLEGRLTRAHQGTLFLDDVDQSGPALQAHLIQFLEDRLVRPVGAREPQPVDLRVIGCMARQGQVAPIQPALLYRLAAVRLHIPPLRERREDIPLIFAHLLDAAARRFRRVLPPVSRAILAHLLDHDWPGNVHELARFADRLTLGLEQEPALEDGSLLPLDDRLDAFERMAIIDAIQSVGGDMGKAIATLGLPRKTFYYRVRRLGIDLRKVRGLDT